jgi:glycine cleavage system regulatory protein
VIELSEADHITTAATAIAVEKVFVRVHQEAGIVVFMQRAQPHPSATAEAPRRLPIMRLQIAH